MSRREDIDNAIWSDPPFADLSPNAKLVYLWSFTNTRCGMSGIYKCSERMAAFETGLSVDDVEEALGELGARRFVFFEDGMLWVRSRVKHLRVRSRQMATSIANDLVKAGQHRFVREFVLMYAEQSWLVAADVFANVTEHRGKIVDLPGSMVLEKEEGRTLGEGQVDARVRVLFDYWRERCDHKAAKLTSERRRKIAARLHEGYSPEQVREGIDGAARAPFINEQGRRFDDIELICRNGSKLESFMARTTAVGRSKMERDQADFAALGRLMGDAA